MSGTDANGRVTLAVLSTKLDDIHGDVSEIKAEISRMNETIHETQKNQARHDVRLDHLERRSQNWDIGNTILSVVAAIAAAFGIVNK